MADTHSPALVGREAEIARLNALIRQAAAGQGVAVWIEGEPGIGKTAVLDRVTDQCALHGMRVLRGNAEGLERRLPFAAIGACLTPRTPDPRADPDEVPGPQAARVARLLRGEGALGASATAANHELAVTEAMLDLVDEWCTHRPVALIIDDAHWIDPASLVVLHRLGRGIDQQPLLMVLTSPPVVPGEAIGGLVRSLGRRAVPLTLGPLPEAAVAMMAQNTLGAPVGPELAKLLEGADGNPMYVTELLAALRGEGAIETVRGAAELSGQTAATAPGWVPSSLVEVIRQRLEYLPGKVREVLEMAAALGSTVDVTELSLVLDRSVMELSAMVIVAVENGLLVDAGPHLEFRHGLIREALAGRLPPQLRTALHLRAGHVLAASGAAVERVAEHLLAGTMLDRETLQWLIRSADTLIVRAPSQAVSLLRRALATADEETTDLLHYHLIRALLWEGSPVQAEQVARVALAVNDDLAREGALWWLLMQAVFRQGRLDDTVAVAREALDSPQTTAAERGRFDGFAAIWLFYLGRFAEAQTTAERAIAAGTQTGDAHSVGLGHLALSALEFITGDMARALTHNDRVLAAFAPGVQPDMQVDPYTMHGYCLLELGRFREADEALATAVRHNQACGGVYLPTAHLLRAQLCFLDGRWDDALAEVRSGLDGPDPLDQSLGMHGVAALVGVHRGQLGGYNDDIPDPGLGADEPMKYEHLLRWAQALIKEAEAGPEQALAVLYPLWEEPALFNPRRIIYAICADLARLAATVGDQDRLRELARTTGELARREHIASLDATSQLCRGLAEDDPDLLLAAARTYGEAGWPLHEGHAYEDAAVVLARLGRAAPARDALNRALAAYTALEAATVIARAESRLRQVGLRRGVRGPRNRPKQGWEALTETEHRVALLVAEGRSNPDIAAQMYLSRRTVQSHVSSILAKLSVSSRVELVISASHRTAEEAVAAATATTTASTGAATATAQEAG